MGHWRSWERATFALLRPWVRISYAPLFFMSKHIFFSEFYNQLLFIKTRANIKCSENSRWFVPGKITNFLIYKICIYIPICFYLNREGMRWILLLNLLYIPICFYLNEKRGHRADQCDFALHSNMFLFKRQKLLFHEGHRGTFTFQYVSI